MCVLCDIKITLTLSPGSPGVPGGPEAPGGPGRPYFKQKISFDSHVFIHDST